MKYLIALLCTLFILASNVAFITASEDAIWVADYNRDAPIVVSDFELASDYASNLTSAEELSDDVAFTRKYLELLANDSKEAFVNSQKHAVSSELQKVKTNYELALASFKRGAEKVLQGYIQNDAKMIIRGLERLEKGAEFMRLADQALNVTPAGYNSGSV